MKICTKCKQIKEDSEYSPDRRRSTGLYSWCRSCMRESNMDYRNKHRLQMNERRRESYKENKDTENKRHRDWHQANKEKVSLQRKEYYQRLEVKEKNRVNVKARRRIGRSISKDVMNHIIWCKKQDCLYCGGPGGSHDHVIPVIQGGEWTIENIVPACISCNSSKHTRTPEEWVNRWYERVIA